MGKFRKKYTKIKYLIHNLLIRTIKLMGIVLLFLFLITFATVANAESDLCPIDNSEMCQSTQEAQIFGDSDYTESCDKTIYFFYGEECKHCREFEKYLDDDILKNHPEIEVRRLEVWHNQENYKKMILMLEQREVRERSVPTVIVGHQTFVGYGGDALTGVEIKKSIYDLYCIDEEVEAKSLKVPFLGKVNLDQLSLPIITVVLGVVDGFNPCAMWALIALITILLATKDRKKIRLVGTVFLISSWLIYYLFIALYLNTFLLLSFTTIVRYIIGAIALIVGVVYIRSFITYQPGVCKVTNKKQQKSITERMKKIVVAKSTWLIIVGVIALAFSVNLIEMVCSIGLPVIYTQILAISNLSKAGYYLYLALYNTLYMLDDIAVFIIAAVTLNYVNLNYKYERAMKLVGGISVIILGLVLIFKSELLSF